MNKISLENNPELVEFILEAKGKTYAGEGQPGSSSRTASHDLPYGRGHYRYLDTYLGGLRFIGEEAVWIDDQPVWGMNYYGFMLTSEIPEGFSPFLKKALLAVPANAPYRGPERFVQGDFEFRCTWQGELACFTGCEEIWWRGAKIYELHFHGGQVE